MISHYTSYIQRFYTACQQYVGSDFACCCSGMSQQRPQCHVQAVRLEASWPSSHTEAGTMHQQQYCVATVLEYVTCDRGGA